MSEPDSTSAIHVALGLSGRHLVDLTGDPELVARLDAQPFAFTVAGLDRIDGSPADGPTLDPSAAVASLANQAPRSTFLVSAAPHRDHPYNLARRITSLGLLTQERTGLLLGIEDALAPRGPEGGEAWGGAALSPGSPLSVETTRDAAVVVQELIQTWPNDSLVADLDTGIYVQADEIRYADHDGVFRVAGPLNAPAPPGGSPVTAWYADSPEAVAAAADVVDLVVLPPATPDEVSASAGVLSRADGSHFLDPDQRALLFVTIDVGVDIDAVEAAVVAAVAAGAVGVVLRPGQSAAELTSTLDTVVPRLQQAGLVHVNRATNLRDRLELPAAADLLVDARPAFAAPQPQASLA